VNDSRWSFKDLGTRFGVEDRRGTLIILKLSQEDLAEMIGSSRPMVSKLVGDMVEEGMLARGEQHHFILPREAEQQSKLASSSKVTQWARAVGSSKSPARMAVRSSIPASGDQSRVAPIMFEHDPAHGSMPFAERNEAAETCQGAARL
jgi:hypothetical protein